MIHDHNGAPTETNAPRREADCIEVVLAFPSLIQEFEEWLAERGRYLFPIPLLESADSLPAYGVGFLSESPTPPATTTTASEDR